MTKIAIIRIAGQQGLNKKVKNTFKLLNLHKKNSCVIIDSSDSVNGMIKVIKDHARPAPTSMRNVDFNCMTKKINDYIP